MVCPCYVFNQRRRKVPTDAPNHLLAVSGRVIAPEGQAHQPLLVEALDVGEEPLRRVELRAVRRLGYVEEVALQQGLVQWRCVRGVVVTYQDWSLPRVVFVPYKDILDEVSR